MVYNRPPQGPFPPPFGGGPGQPFQPPPGGQPFPSPPGGMQQGPSGPPPQAIPQKPGGAGLYRVDPGAISGCLYRYTYVWLTNGHSFWFYPTFVGRSSVSGFRWQHGNWMYYGIDLNRIESFTCYY